MGSWALEPLFYTLHIQQGWSNSVAIHIPTLFIGSGDRSAVFIGIWGSIVTSAMAD